MGLQQGRYDNSQTLTKSGESTHLEWNTEVCLGFAGSIISCIAEEEGNS
jgi:hypothetical protein